MRSVPGTDALSYLLTSHEPYPETGTESKGACMPNEMTFTFSDLISGYVTGFSRERDTFGLKTSDGRDFEAKLTATTYAEIVRNLGEAYLDCTGQMRDMLTPGRFAYAYGTFFPEQG